MCPYRPGARYNALGKKDREREHSNPNPTWIREMGNPTQIGAR